MAAFKFVKIEELKEIPEIKKMSVPYTEKEQKLMETSFKKDGFNPAVSMILITPDKEVIDGYKRIEIAQKLGIKSIPVITYEVYEDSFRDTSVKKAIVKTRLIEIALQRNMGHNFSEKEMQKIGANLHRLENKKEKLDKISMQKQKEEARKKVLAL